MAKRANAELINGLIGMDLSKVCSQKAGEQQRVHLKMLFSYLKWVNDRTPN